MFLLNDVALYIMVILQFSCNRFCFKKRNVFSSQLHCRELPSSAACQFALGSALPPSLSLCLIFVCISYLVYCTSILEDGLVTHSFSGKKDDLVQLKRPSEMVVAPRYELLTLIRLLALFLLRWIRRIIPLLRILEHLRCEYSKWLFAIRSFR